MQKFTEETLRTTLSLDETISKSDIERAISIISGNPSHREDLVRIIKINAAAKMLGITREGVLNHIKQGYLTRIAGINGQVLGIRSDSLEAFMHRRIVHKSMPTQRTDK